MQPRQNLPNNDLVGASTVIEAWRIYQRELGRSVSKIISFDHFSPCNTIKIEPLIAPTSHPPEDRLSSTRMSFWPVTRWMKELFPAPVTPITAMTTREVSDIASLTTTWGSSI
jgi:hypothetical protein